MDRVNCTTPIALMEGRKHPGFGMPAAPIDRDDLRGLALFQHLSDAHLDTALRRFNRLTLRTGQFAFHQGQAGEAVYLTLRGTLRLFVTRSDGREATLAIVGSGDMPGITSLFEGDAYPLSAVALERAVLLWVSRAALRELLAAIPPLSVNLNRILAHALRRAQAHTQVVTTQDAAGRLACVLLGFARDYGRPSAAGIQITLRLSQGDLASMYRYDPPPYQSGAALVSRAGLDRHR